MAGSLQEQAIPVKDHRHRRHADHRQHRELPIHPKGDGETGNGLERLADDPSADQIQAVRRNPHVIRESRHQLRLAVPHQRLVIEFQRVPEAVLAQRHDGQFDDTADQHLLNERRHSLGGRPDHQDQQNPGVRLELIVRNPRHEFALNPTTRDETLSLRTELAGRSILSVQNLFVGGNRLAILRGREIANCQLPIEFVQFDLTFLDLAFAGCGLDFDVLLKALVLQQHLHDHEGQ